MKLFFTALVPLIAATSFAEDESKRALDLPLEMQQLMATREQAIADIDAKFERAVRELRAEFRQKGDTRSVLQLDAWMAKHNDPMDELFRRHDICYDLMHSGARMQEADEELVSQLKVLPPESLTEEGTR